MMLYYRADLFDQLGLHGADDLGRVRAGRRAGAAEGPEAVPDHVLRRRPGLVRRAGPAGRRLRGGASTATPGRSPSTTRPPRRSPTTGATWSPPASIDNQPMYTPEWNKALNDGTLIAWPSAVWGPGVLSGNAADTKGKWKMAPLPQWTAGDDTTGSWGGSSTAVTAKSKHTGRGDAVRDLAQHRPDGDQRRWSRSGGIYPAATAAPDRRRRWPSAPAFFSNQPDFYTAGQADRGDRGRRHLGPERQRHLQRPTRTPSARRSPTRPPFGARGRRRCRRPPSTT